MSFFTATDYGKGASSHDADGKCHSDAASLRRRNSSGYLYFKTNCVTKEQSDLSEYATPVNPLYRLVTISREESTKKTLWGSRKPNPLDNGLVLTELVTKTSP